MSAMNFRFRLKSVIKPVLRPPFLMAERNISALLGPKPPSNCGDRIKRKARSLWMKAQTCTQVARDRMAVKIATTKVNLSVLSREENHLIGCGHQFKEKKSWMLAMREEI